MFNDFILIYIKQSSLDVNIVYFKLTREKFTFSKQSCKYLQIPVTYRIMFYC
jgi:hypothetical protein